jgi:hypothetical protein
MTCARSGCPNTPEGDLLYCSDVCFDRDIDPIPVTPINPAKRFKHYCRKCSSDVCENAGHPVKRYPCRGKKGS